MKHKNLLIFDIDGTLTESVSVHQKTFKAALIKMGFANFNDNWSSYQHHTDSFIFKTIFEKETGQVISIADIEAFEQCLTKLLEDDTAQNPITEIQGASAFFHTLCYDHFDIAFATGSLFQPALLKLMQSGLMIDEALIIASNKYFSREDVVGQAIRAAQDHYGTSHYNRIFSFGDGRWDYEAAQNLGLVFIGIGNAELLQLGARHYFKDFTDCEVIPLISNVPV
ncbi:MAG: HAD hydrolase-like protein [Taibaiella sp.]|nr:HAD hydrolase-like protein [Taibaiella sp.]